jgi:hypothetical protein
VDIKYGVNNESFFHQDSTIENGDDDDDDDYDVVERANLIKLLQTRHATMKPLNGTRAWCYIMLETRGHSDQNRPK